MRTLVIKYTPREKYSRTKDLLDYFVGLIFDVTDGDEHNTIRQIDLADTLPDPMTRERLLAYYKRNYQKETLTIQDQHMLEQMDSFALDLHNTDVLVIACPIYHFGAPAIVKAWLESAIQRGIAYGVDEQDGVIPKLSHLRVLTLYTAGILFDDTHGTTGWNTLPTMIEANFQWTGARDIRIVGIEGLDMLPNDEIQHRINSAKKRLHAIFGKWYMTHHKKS
jgi:FMN-dependent NADH-azoreductase